VPRHMAAGTRGSDASAAHGVTAHPAGQAVGVRGDVARRRAHAAPERRIAAEVRAVRRAHRARLAAPVRVVAAACLACAAAAERSLAESGCSRDAVGRDVACVCPPCQAHHTRSAPLVQRPLHLERRVRGAHRWPAAQGRRRYVAPGSSIRSARRRRRRAHRAPPRRPPPGAGCPHTPAWPARPGAPSARAPAGTPARARRAAGTAPACRPCSSRPPHPPARPRGASALAPAPAARAALARGSRLLGGGAQREGRGPAARARRRRTPAHAARARSSRPLPRCSPRRRTTRCRTGCGSRAC